MPRRILHVPLAEDLLRRVADHLLATLPGSPRGDLSDALVLLPSARACRALEHELLAQSGRESLLLPRLLTDTQWAEERAAALGLDDADLPDDGVRAILLTHRLQGADWLEGGDAAAPGLAEAFVDFFDEVRRHRLDGRVLDGRQSGPLVELARAADAETVAGEVERIREVWQLYRDAVPRDPVDRLAETVEALGRGEGLPTRPPAVAMVAGFGRVDPLRAGILNAALDHGAEGILWSPEAAAPLDRLLLATWGAEEQATDALASTRQLLSALGYESTAEPAGDPPLGKRLAALADDQAAVGDNAPSLLVADNPEDEARAVAGRVAAWLDEHGAPDTGVTVATNDPQLAARITARLRDAGLDADNTVGEPLAAQPAGLLLRFVLRAALTELRADHLLEVLGHPFTRLTDDGTATGTWALRLERMFRRETGPQAGLAGLLRRARERDAAAEALFSGLSRGMKDFIDRVAAAFAPLLDLADGRPRDWTVLLDALEEVWANAAPDRPLAEHRDQPDLTEAARLLARLRDDAHRLPPVDLAGFAADLGRLLNAATVVPHRPRSIPILVTGLVEARLARNDLLVLAGLNDGVFPTAAGTPVVLPGRVRRRLQLPTWREARARDAELFLRLLHGAPEVLVTWSRRRDGQPALPSPLVERLQLALGEGDPEVADGTTWVRTPPPLADINARQSAFAAEPAGIGRHAESRLLHRLSWTMLRDWRDCPYRALLERGYALRPDEEVRDEFGRKEYGSVVHQLLWTGLQAGAPLHDALANGNRDGALAALTGLAEEFFLPGVADLPQRRLWFDAFVRLVPDLATVELDRFQRWRPTALEAEFQLPLADLDAWRRAADETVPPLPQHAVDVGFVGTIDRVDRAQAGGGLEIIDYKTGSVPTFISIGDGEDLQLALYALAVELGAVPDCGGAVTGAFFYGVSDKALGPSLPKGKPHPLQRDPDEVDDPLVEAAGRLIDLACAASDPDSAFPLLPRHAAGDVTGELPCRWCGLRGVCRLEERLPTPSVAAKVSKLVGAREVGR